MQNVLALLNSELQLEFGTFPSLVLHLLGQLLVLPHVSVGTEEPGEPRQGSKMPHSHRARAVPSLQARGDQTQPMLLPQLLAASPL